MSVFAVAPVYRSVTTVSLSARAAVSNEGPALVRTPSLTTQSIAVDSSLSSASSAECVTLGSTTVSASKQSMNRDRSASLSATNKTVNVHPGSMRTVRVDSR